MLNLMSGLSYDILMSPLEKMGLSKLRHSLLKKAKGEILEIGVGTGLNLCHYGTSTSVTAIEPEDSKRKRALKRSAVKNAENGRVLIQVTDGNAEDLKFSDKNFDTVVGTLVFCSIPH